MLVPFFVGIVPVANGYFSCCLLLRQRSEMVPIYCFNSSGSSVIIKKLSGAIQGSFRGEIRQNAGYMA